MESFLDSCVEKFCHLAQYKRADLKPATTPFIDEAKAQKEQLAELAKEEDRAAKSGEEPKTLDRGELSDDAARILMKLLYGARLARYDLLRAIGHLASQVTKWTRWSDARLLKLIRYVNSSPVSYTHLTLPTNREV